MCWGLCVREGVCVLRNSAHSSFSAVTVRGLRLPTQENNQWGAAEALGLSSEELKSRAAGMKALPDLAVLPFPTYPMYSYLLKQFHSVSGGESRRRRGAGTPVVMAGSRDAVY